MFFAYSYTLRCPHIPSPFDKLPHILPMNRAHECRGISKKEETIWKRIFWAVTFRLPRHVPMWADATARAPRTLATDMRDAEREVSDLPGVPLPWSTHLVRNSVHSMTLPLPSDAVRCSVNSICPSVVATAHPVRWNRADAAPLITTHERTPPTRGQGTRYDETTIQFPRQRRS